MNWELTGDGKDHEGVRTKDVLNNLLGQGIKEKVHHHWEGDPWAKAGLGRHLQCAWGEGRVRSGVRGG